MRKPKNQKTDQKQNVEEMKSPASRPKNKTKEDPNLQKKQEEKKRCDDREVECDCLENNNGQKPSWVQIPLILERERKKKNLQWSALLN